MVQVKAKHNNRPQKCKSISSAVQFGLGCLTQIQSNPLLLQQPQVQHQDQVQLKAAGPRDQQEQQRQMRQALAQSQDTYQDQVNRVNEETRKQQQQIDLQETLALSQVTYVQDQVDRDNEERRKQQERRETPQQLLYERQIEEALAQSLRDEQKQPEDPGRSPHLYPFANEDGPPESKVDEQFNMVRSVRLRPRNSAGDLVPAEYKTADGRVTRAWIDLFAPNHFNTQQMFYNVENPGHDWCTYFAIQDGLLNRQRAMDHQSQTGRQATRSGRTQVQVIEGLIGNNRAGFQIKLREWIVQRMRNLLNTQTARETEANREARKLQRQRIFIYTEGPRVLSHKESGRQDQWERKDGDDYSQYYRGDFEPNSIQQQINVWRNMKNHLANGRTVDQTGQFSHYTERVQLTREQLQFLADELIDGQQTDGLRFSLFQYVVQGGMRGVRRWERLGFCNQGEQKPQAEERQLIQEFFINDLPLQQQRQYFNDLYSGQNALQNPIFIQHQSAHHTQLIPNRWGN